MYNIASVMSADTRAERAAGVFTVSEVTAYGDENFKISSESIQNLTSKFEYRIKANKMELKRRALLADKIAWDAVEKYCSERVVKTKFFDSQDIDG
jgi:hypothetical protein